MRGTFVGTDPAGRVGRPWPGQYDSSDQALIEKVASGNRLAMQVLFARHHTRVYRFVLRLVGNEAPAEDVTSEVFLTLWRQAPPVQGGWAATTRLLAVAPHKGRARPRPRPQNPPPAPRGTSHPAAHPPDA